LWLSIGTPVIAACGGDGDGGTGAASGTGGTSSATGASSAGGAAVAGSGGTGGAPAAGGAATTTGGSASSGGASAGGGASQPTSGCGLSAIESGEHTVSVDGAERTYLVDVPADYDASTPYPLVFGFHGATTSGSAFRGQFYGNLLSAMASEAIVVHADALGDPTAWDNEADVSFFDAMLDEISAALCIDEGRVFATGHSSGGFFTNALGCERGDVLRGIAPVSGGGPFVFGGAGCTGQVAAWIAHGESDDTVAFSNGEESRDHWAEANGCDPVNAMPSTPAQCVEYAGCDAGFAVRFCAYEGGHEWPSFAPQGMWDFFESL
jgi:poly(3-hydroxybutyrate) depolymerase